jgi:hypothetical protein
LAQTALRELNRAPPVGMEPFLVLFDDWRGAGDSRLEQTGAQSELAEANRRKLLDFIEKRGLAGQVASVAASTLLGAIGVIMTPDAARKIKALDGVTRVMRSR